jgi:hypothetical protein
MRRESDNLVMAGDGLEGSMGALVGGGETGAA